MSALEQIKQLTRELFAEGASLTMRDDYLLLYHDCLTDAERDYADRYADCIRDGCSPSLADMLSSATPPGCVTDSTFLAGHCCGNQFEKTPEVGDRLREIAESQGQMTKGKVYLGSLARYPGDPKAWVDGRGDVKRVCEERGWGCEGDVKVAPKEVGRLPHRKAPPGSLASRLHAAGLPMAG